MDPSPCGPGSTCTPALSIFPHESEQRPWDFRNCFVLLDVGLLLCDLTLSEPEAASRSRSCPGKTPCLFSWPWFPSGILQLRSFHPTMQSTIWSMTGTCACSQCSSPRRNGTWPAASQSLCCRCNLQRWLSAGPALPGGFPFPCLFRGLCLCGLFQHLTGHQRKPSSTSTCLQRVQRGLLVDEEVVEVLPGCWSSASRPDGWICCSWGRTSSWPARWHMRSSWGLLSSECPCPCDPSSAGCNPLWWSHRVDWPRRTLYSQHHMCRWCFRWRSSQDW